MLAVYFDKTGTHAQSCSEAGSPACASVRGWRGSRPDASGMACPFCDRRPALSRRLLRRRARDLHVRRRHVCSRDLHSLECGAAGSRAAVRIPRRRVPGRPRHLRGRRGRALDDADEDLLKSTLLAFENWVSRRNGVGARVSAPSTGFTRSRRQRGLPHRVAGEAEGMPTTTLLRSAARRQLYSASSDRRPYCLTTMPRLQQPGRAGRRERNRSLRRWPGQSGPARIPDPVSGSSCRRCTPVPGSRRVLLAILRAPRWTTTCPSAPTHAPLSGTSAA